MGDPPANAASQSAIWPPTWPMGLTMLRLLLLPVFLWLLLIDADQQHPHPHRWWAVAVFAIMAITDKLDGYLARRLNQTSTLGALLDPVADKLLIACSVILLSFEWVAGPDFRIPLLVVGFIYGKDVLVAMGTLVVISLVGRIRISARWLGKASTFLQLTLVIATLIAPDLERLAEWLPRVLLAALWVVVSLLAVASCVDYVLVGIRRVSAARRGETDETE
jgi:CDP-diacylglycerol--glycerol-3-phosphate 3-phosphatidyltransferase